ncbi:hypothetical protein ACFRFH_03825 [Leifsonia sp. NPDC056824]|uniref:hypothetical protein n=1 Tax=Leifsonia sp. NPDC056824 TaxID=3345953 RepID=UPI003699CDBA
MSSNPEESSVPDEAHVADTSAPVPDPEVDATVTEAEVRVHRSPRYFRFMLTGAIVFAVIALILTFAFPANPTYDRGQVFGFLLAICATIGVAVGALVALLIDRSVTRRARTVQADRIDVRLPDAGAELDTERGAEPGPRSDDARGNGSSPSVDS